MNDPVTTFREVVRALGLPGDVSAADVYHALYQDAPAWSGPAAPSSAVEASRRAAAITKLAARDVEPRPETSTPLPWEEYDTIIVGFSGGKDSLASLLRVLESIPAHKRGAVELQHHVIDGDPEQDEQVFDWPVTEAYCRAVAAALGVPIYFSWRERGILGEMQLDNERRHGITFEAPGGKRYRVPIGTRAAPVTRRMLDANGKRVGNPAWPQQVADLNQRWCSASAKIEVARAVFRHDPRFSHDVKIALVTGERRAESSGRSRYAFCEEHASDARRGKRRRIDQVRLVLEWTQEEVWAIIARHGIVPHPCYWLGFGRASCATCIFSGADEWATLAELLPTRVARIEALEEWAHATIDISGRSVRERIQGGYDVTSGRGENKRTVQAEPGVSLAPHDALLRAYWAAQARAHDYTAPVRVPPERWILPTGALRKGAGSL